VTEYDTAVVVVLYLLDFVEFPPIVFDRTGGKSVDDLTKLTLKCSRDNVDVRNVRK
jgi:hypothetical protein